MSSAQPDRFRAVFNCFRIVFGPFSDRFGPFRTVFAPFFSVFSHRGAAARPQRRHSAAAAPSQRRRSRFSTPVRRQRIRNLSFFAIFWEAPVGGGTGWSEECPKSAEEAGQVIDAQQNQAAKDPAT